MFIFERESMQAGEGQRERGRHRTPSRLQALSYQHKARCGAWTHKPWDHDLSRSQTLNQLTTQAPQFSSILSSVFPLPPLHLLSLSSEVTHCSLCSSNSLPSPVLFSVPGMPPSAAAQESHMPKSQPCCTPIPHLPWSHPLKGNLFSLWTLTTAMRSCIEVKQWGLLSNEVLLQQWGLLMF